MTTILLLLAAIGLTIGAILRILGVRVVTRPPRTRRPKRMPRPAGVEEAEGEPETEKGLRVRAASSRLLIALLLIAAGAALLIVVAIQWIGGILRGILS